MGMFINKKWLIIFFTLFISGIFFAHSVRAGTLSCAVRTSICNGGEVEIFEMQNTTNSTAGLSAASYNNLVCCTGVTGLGNLCSGTFATALKLSGTTNAHVRQGTLADYPSATNACISVPSGGSVSVGYRSGGDTCATVPAFDTTLGSMIGTTNSHIGDGNWVNGSTKICATASGGFSTAIEIRAQDYTTSVSSITFPQATPESTVSGPYNNIDSSGNPQTFGGAGTAKPVVTLYNGGGSTLTIWYNITTFTNSIVSSENYLVNTKGAACTDASCITGSVTFDTDTIIGTTIATGAGNEKDFYLKAILSAVAGKTGTSTLTILGEAP